MKFNNFQSYRHDVPGKLANINRNILTLDELSFYTDTGTEVLAAVHESLVKILTSSSKHLLNRENSQFTLLIGNEIKASHFTKIKLGGYDLKLTINEGQQNLYFETQNRIELDLMAIGAIKALMPIKTIIIEPSSPELIILKERLDSV